MSFTLVSIVAALALFAGMLALMELGTRIGRRRLERDPEGVRSGTGAAEGAVFALLGLLIAFTFTGAVQRFSWRRTLIVTESNAIGTAWLRLDVLPEPARADLRQRMREYLDARLSAYRAPEDESAIRTALAHVGELQTELWSGAAAACRAESLSAAILLLPALNDAFDVASERNAAVEEHPPSLVFGLLIAMALACALLAGIAMAPSPLKQWTYRLAFASVISITFYAIRDLEYPRHGLVRVDNFDHVLFDLRASMK